MDRELETLLEIWAQDQKIDELKDKIENLETGRRRLREQLGRREAQLENEHQTLQEWKQESRRRNDEVDALDDQIKRYRKQLDEGIISYREIEALRLKIEQIKEQMEDLEDGAIELMMKIESQEAQLDEHQQTFQKQKEQIERGIQEVGEEIQAAEVLIEQRERVRGELAEKIDPNLLGHYEQLRREYRDAVVSIIAGSCAGCQLNLSETTIERVAEGREIVGCENCSRILYTR
ncbi:MAG: zinc ribbon domain-containing protein [Candidatus Bipolaricaulia bacterium]